MSIMSPRLQRVATRAGWWAPECAAAAVLALVFWTAYGVVGAATVAVLLLLYVGVRVVAISVTDRQVLAARAAQDQANDETERAA